MRRADGGVDGRGGGCGRRSGRRWRLRPGEASTATGNEGGGCETRRRQVPGGRGEGKSGKEEEGWRRLGGSPERVVEGEIGNDGPGRRKGGEIGGEEVVRKRRLGGSLERDVEVELEVEMMEVEAVLNSSSGGGARAAAAAQRRRRQR